MSAQPYDFAQAQAAQRQASERQRAAEQFVIDAWKRYAAAERAYREALGKRITELRADGMAATACADVARGDKHVAALRVARDIAEGVRDAATQAAWRASADRKAEQTFTEWSAKQALAEAYSPPTGAGPTFGSRRAA